MKEEVEKAYENIQIEWIAGEQAVLTIYQGDLQILYNIPCNSLNAIQQNGGTSSFQSLQPLLRQLENISWTKSFIQLPTAPATTDVVYAIGIYYSCNY